MDAVTSILLCGVLQILYIQAVLGNGCHTVLNGCCIKCNAGYFLPNKCGPCTPCTPKGYADRPNERPYCDHCRRCEGIFLYKERCTSTSNAVCTCVPGKSCADEKCTVCKSDRCQAGQQLEGQKCLNCPMGTFNTGAEHRCIPWKNCTAQGAVVITNGSRTSDVVCGGYVTKVKELPSPAPAVTAITSIKSVIGKSSGESNLQVIYIVVSCSIGLFLIVICIVCRKKLTETIKHIFQTIPKPVVKQAEEEEGCSCHYPEEERGGENEPMTLVA